MAGAGNALNRESRIGEMERGMYTRQRPRKSGGTLRAPKALAPQAPAPKALAPKALAPKALAPKALAPKALGRESDQKGGQ